MSGLDFLQTVDIFQGLNPHQLGSIQKKGRRKEYLYGDRVFAEGEDANHVWVVIAGQIDLRFDLPGRSTSEENTIFSIASAQTLGWSKSCQILKIDKDHLLNLFEKDARMGFIFMTNLAAVASMHFHRLQDSATVSPVAMVKITVHMATCGIAAGARGVMNALVDEISHSDRQDIQLASSGCIGDCKNEPNVTVEIAGEAPVIYQKMTPDKIRQVFKNHILGGEVQEDYIFND
jgi:NADP-reducing hydrogenase subunit HndB